MKISEWKQRIEVSQGLINGWAEADKQRKEFELAKEAVANYEKYKCLLRAKMIKKLRKWAEEGLGFMAICLHGDQKNVFCRYRGSWTEDYKGKITDSDVDDSHIECIEHGRIDYICEIIDAIQDIDEFKEVVKLLQKIES